MRNNIAVGVLLTVLLFGALFVGTTAAVQSETGDLPAEAEVGSDIETTVELSGLFEEFESWTVAVDTQLENATWTITQFNQAGSEIEREEFDGESAAQSVDIDDGTATVEIRVTGTTPGIDEFRYEPPEQFTVMNLTQEREGGADRDLESYETHHFTAESKEARQAIDQARTAVEGSGSSDAQSSLDSAISAYENGNFENALQLAERAEDEATQRQLIRNALLVGAVVVVVALIAFGGYRVYKARQKGPSRLQ